MKNPHSLVQNPNGTWTIHNSDVSENMHSLIGPELEAQQVYIRQSGFEQSLAETDPHPLVVFDLGLGAGTNALASIQAMRRMKSEGRPLRKLILHSFEIDTTGFELALANSDKFPFFDSLTGPSHELLKTGRFIANDYDWYLHTGDFREHFLKTNLPKPDIVYYDMYSPKTSSELWQGEAIESLVRLAGSHPLVLVTYSVSGVVKRSLASYGFQVSKGPPTPAKKNTLIARLN